jgi:hypothetical protein
VGEVVSERARLTKPWRLYRARPSLIEAVRWQGDNLGELTEFAGEAVRLDAGGGLQLLAGHDAGQGWVPVAVGHWIVRAPGDLADYWPVEAAFFASKYERFHAGG